MTENSLTFFVGGYGEPGQPTLKKCRYDGDANAFEVLAENARLVNPSWLTIHPARPLLYAVEELGPEGRVAALDLSGGGIRFIGAWGTGGQDPCHIALSPEARHLLVANYSGGSLAAFELDGNGLPARMTDLVRHRMGNGDAASGIPQRQSSPHVHSAAFHRGQVYAADLGMDRVMIYDWQGDAGRLSMAGEIAFPRGSGPRHLVWSRDGRHMYVVCELSAQIHVLARDAGGGWRPVQVVPVIPEGEAPDFASFDWSICAAIRWLSPDRLCVSTRAHDSLTVFEVKENGRLHRTQTVSSGGRNPRDFNAFGPSLLVANQSSDRVEAFSVDAADGRLTPAGAWLQACRPTSIAIRER